MTTTVPARTSTNKDQTSVNSAARTENTIDSSTSMTQNLCSAQPSTTAQYSAQAS